MQKIFNDYLYEQLKEENIPYKEYRTLIADKKKFSAEISLSGFYLEECKKLKYVNIFDVVNNQLAKQAANYFKSELVKNENIDFFIFVKDIPVSIECINKYEVFIYKINILYNEIYKL